ncbi:protein uxt-like isoform 1 [Lynx pardinus]|uniref:Protein UXT n=1 Tax=Lynx pardinus TaxID=191816 RepID=A0A485PG20_LYNPA|nr:protein uxt-like isoform 1 [Lynx pardinus]
MNGGGAEREGDTESETGSRLRAISPEPDAGLELTDREIVTWLKKVLDHRDKVYEQLAKYLQLRNVIERLQEAKPSELYMQVDLGCNFFVDTVVPDTSRIYVALGYGFFLELTLAEALKFIDRKSNLLTELSDSLTKDSMNIKAHIHMLLEGLRELQGLQNFPETPHH